MTHKYDIALSFAGEDRAYVEAVALDLRYAGITCFYDGFEESELWGKDLYIHLDEIYRKTSTYFIMFISEHYANKLWTNHERRSAQARDFIESNSEYILPARFDETEIPGLRTTVGFIDLRKKTPVEFSTIIQTKILGRREYILRSAFAEAISLTEKFLRPQPLSNSDMIAEQIRIAFRRTGYTPNAENLKPYLNSKSPEERVVGYIAYQTGPFMMIGAELQRCLNRELEFAKVSNETRPLWQILICLAVFATITNAEETQFLHFDLDQALKTLKNNDKLDPGGECKTKIKGLMGLYPWMTTNPSKYYNKYSSYAGDLEELFRHFQWKNGKDTYTFADAINFIQCYPDLVAEHIEEGHFSNWYSIHLPASATPADLLFAISREIKNYSEQI